MWIIFRIIFDTGQSTHHPTNKKPRYDLPEDARVNITIYDIMGKIVNNLVSSQKNAGYKSIQWNATSDAGSPVSAGIYLYIIQAGKEDGISEINNQAQHSLFFPLLLKIIIHYYLF